jgi:murein L,D-transpeptidase YcbB/YkuD
MRTLRLDLLLSGTALAVVLIAGTCPGALAGTPDQIESKVPMPESADVAPLTPADLGTQATTTKPTAVVPTDTSKKADVDKKPDVDKKADADKKDAGPSTTTVTPAKSEATDASQGKDQGKPVIATTLAPADQAVAEKMRDLLAGKAERLFGGKKERATVEAFYAGRGFAPLWVENGAGNDRSKAAIARLAAADADGLDPSDYATPDFKTATTPDALADDELKLTAATLTYARYAQAGRVHFSRVSADISYTIVAPDPADVLAKLADTKDVDALLGSYNPPQAGYKALKQKLAEVRGRKGDTGPARLATGPVVKVGAQDPRVPQVRERLGVAANGDDTTFDKTLAEAVKKYQREHDLSPSGTINNAVIESLNGPRHDRDADIIVANMERWRWMPRDLGKTYVMVNIPAYTLRVMRDSSPLWTTRIVVGQPGKPTPLISATMQYITVNPTWNVPPSIIQNEYLPALEQDPQALDRIGLKVEHNPDGTIHIFQPPGDGNALGRIRFNFPNKFLVYQHDTPDKYLFAKEKRAFSHGCMRVQDPIKYAEVLLSIELPKEGYTQERLHRMFGSEEQNINFPMPLPVHITYQTAYVDDAGKLVILDDVYGRDARMIQILKGEERRVAEIPVERRETTISHPIKDPNPFAARSTARGFNLFGGFFR